MLGVCLTLLLVVFAGIYTSATQEKSYDANTASGDVLTSRATLIVQPQSGADTVQVDRVTLTEGGFLAVRAVDDNRLGQIVEISEYLAPGTHNNLSIPLGEFYDGGEELIVMMYEDAGNNKIFNDLDQPYEENGTPVAVYVATGQSVSESVVTNTAADGIPLMGMGAMEFISYTDSGFEPKDISISLGTMVHFVNESSIDMWVASDDHPAHTDLPTFDQFKGSGPGEQYVYIFDQAGEWKYHDHLSPTAVGTITVTN